MKEPSLSLDSQSTLARYSPPPSHNITVLLLRPDRDSPSSFKTADETVQRVADSQNVTPILESCFLFSSSRSRKRHELASPRNLHM